MSASPFIRLARLRMPAGTFRGLLLLLVLAPVVHGERLPIKTYATADGLPSNAVNKIVRDSHGFLWLCTADGISRFDGYGFTNFGTSEGLPHPYVNDLLETRAGEYWLATNGGLVRFIPRGIPRRGIAYANNNALDAQPMFSLVLPDDPDRRARAVTVLFEDHEGTIWCGTMKGFADDWSEQITALRCDPLISGCRRDFPRRVPSQTCLKISKARSG